MSGVATLKLRGAKRHFDEMAVDFPLPSQACSPTRFVIRPPPLKRGRCGPSVTGPAPRFSKPFSIIPTNTLSAHFAPLLSPAAASAAHTAPLATSPPASAPASSPSLAASPSASVSASASASAPASSSAPASTSASASASAPASASASASASTAARPAASSTAASPSPAAPSAPNSATLVQNLSEHELAALATHAPRRLKRVVEKVSRGELSLVHKIFSVVDLAEIVTSVLSEREANLNHDYTKLLNERLAEQFRDFTKFNQDYVTRHLRGKDYGYLS